MTYQRTDQKGRVLESGESQRKDGRYVFSYTEEGKRRFLYSWKLVPSDEMPPGKRPDSSLREKEEAVARERAARTGSTRGDMTVLELVDRYFAQKMGLSLNTRHSYRSVTKVIRGDAFGQRPIREIRTSDAKLWLVRLQQEGRSYSFIKTVKAILQPAFAMAVEDDVLGKNPFGFSTKRILINDKKRFKALTEEQEADFLDFVRQDDHYSAYYHAVYILFNTGLRISEFAGLTASDIDLERGVIRVNHQLIRVNGEFHVVEPKSRSGIRVLPMADGVREAFQRILAERELPEQEPEVDGKSGFLFLAPGGGPLATGFWKQAIPRMGQKYNAAHGEPLRVTPHVCRHTYCSKMARRGMNPKVLQYLMGHSSIAITLDVYTHLEYRDAEEELRRIGLVGSDKD